MGKATKFRIIQVGKIHHLLLKPTLHSFGRNMQPYSHVTCKKPALKRYRYGLRLPRRRRGGRVCRVLGSQGTTPSRAEYPLVENELDGEGITEWGLLSKSRVPLYILLLNEKQVAFGNIFEKLKSPSSQCLCFPMSDHSSELLRQKQMYF